MLKFNNNNIFRVFKNNQIVKKICSNNSVVFKYYELPTGYRECKYIQTSGTQYITTDFVPNDYNGNFTVVLDFQGVSSMSSASYLCGCGGTYRCANIRVDSTGSINLYAQNISTTSAVIVAQLSVAQADVLNRNKYKIIMVNQGISKLINGGVEYTQNNNARTASTYNFMIGRSSGTNYPAKFYGCKIYDSSNNLVRHFVPCLDNNDVPCMYELVNKQTFYNSGTGTFGYSLL